jgi:hypothetical protein
MPGISGVTVVTTLVCFISFAREAAGALSARHSLRPLSGRMTAARLGRTRRRENADVCSAVIASASEAIHSFFVARWISSLALAMMILMGCLKFE